MIRRNFAFLLSALVAGLWNAGTVSAETVTYEIDKDHTNVGFRIRHLVSRVKGSFGDFTGTLVFDPADLTKATVEGTIQAVSIDTNHEKRDAHLKDTDFFDVAKFPTLTYKTTRVEKVGDNKYKVTGDLTIKGITKSIALDAEFSGFGADPWGNEKLGLSAAGTLRRADWGISWNKTLDKGGVLIGDEVEIMLEIEANKKK